MNQLWVKRVLLAIGGGIAGYCYYAFIGCRTGTCPITSNPTISTLYGAMVGVLLTLGEKSKASGPR
jgi:hypothetical protein